MLPSEPTPMNRIAAQPDPQMLLAAAGLAFEVVYEGPAGRCPHCASHQAQRAA